VNILKEIYEIDPIKQESFLFGRKMSLHLRQNPTDGMMIHGFEMEGWNRTRRQIGFEAGRRKAGGGTKRRLIRPVENVIHIFR
jgi:hypothetical protein